MRAYKLFDNLIEIKDFAPKPSILEGKNKKKVRRQVKEHGDQVYSLDDERGWEESSCDKVPKNVEIPPDEAQMIKAIEVERLKKEITDEISKREAETPPLRT